MKENTFIENLNYVFQASPGQVRGQTTTLSESIKAFKAKQEAEKKQKLKEESEKKANLLELRAGNKQSSRAANAMLKMAKSANKSAIDEARNYRDTSATLAGRNQCDNDDYGYESKASTSIYEKLMAKYESNPEDPMAKFARPGKPKPLGERGDPKEKKERKPDPKFQPFRKPEDSKPKTDSASHKPSTSSDSKKSGSTSSGQSGSSKAIKKANNLPPPPSFAELMKMAKNGKKPQNPIDLKIPKNKEGEFDRPMTTAQKEEFIRERNSQLRKSGKLPPSTSKPPPASSSSKPEMAKKNSSTSGDAKSSSKFPPNQSNNQEIKGPCKENNFRQPCLKKGGIPAGYTKPAKRDFHSVESRAFPGEVVVQKPPAAKRSWNEVESRPFPGEAQPKKSSKVSNRRDRSPSPLQMQRKKSGSSKSAGNRIESDDEYDSDSEMDDFIDDSDCKIDVSSEIAKMFGYDRRKYRDDDEDDRSMENNSFSSMMKEEARSARIGRQEDLEDMRREEEENRRRANRKKQKSSGGGRSRY